MSTKLRHNALVFEFERVDYRLENKFSIINDVDKKKVKELGPHHPDAEIEQTHKNQHRRFNKYWHDKKTLNRGHSNQEIFILCLLRVIRCGRLLDSLSSSGYELSFKSETNFMLRAHTS